MALPATGNSYSHRQYYGGWNNHSTKTYHYRTYYYKPTPTYVGYKHNYTIYYPSRPNHYYYYSPYTQKYWGRCPTKYEGEAYYSMLADADRKPTVEQIPEKAFPAPGKLPSVPEATDDVKLDLPPDDLPTKEQTPAIGVAK